MTSLFLGCLVGTAAAAGFTFAALGDAPYYDHEEQTFVEMLAAMNREPLAFSVHVGDFKSGSSECSDALYQQRREWFERSAHPFVFVPGDNDWTDCWRTFAGGYDTRERLQKLREMFFAQPASLGQRRMALTRQSDIDPERAYPEHARWIHEGVLFVTLNVPGSFNNATRDRDEFRTRDGAVRSWIAEAFRLTRAKQLAAVVLIMQANPWAATGPQRHVYAPLLETMTYQTQQFPGEVVLIHGDTHRYRVDQPLVDPQTRRPIRNFTRIEVFGSPGVNWVRVRVEKKNGGVTFHAAPGS
ncbi:MAG: hypothetical protein ACT4PS_01370 [Betaproteobacteria bacterium]